MKIVYRLIVALAVGLLAESVDAATIHALGDSSTAGFFQGVAVGKTPRGWDFQVNASGVQVTQLGVNEFLSGFPITLSLWDVGTHTLLAQTSVTPAAPRTWAFTDLGTPVSLAMGGIYSVIAWADTTTIGNAWYLFDNNPPPSFNPTGTIQYLNTRFDNGVGPNTFPSTTLLGAPSSYGVADIGYLTTVPEPSTLILAGIAFPLALILGWRSRHRCRSLTRPGLSSR
jgi:hypothetical protein